MLWVQFTGWRLPFKMKQYFVLYQCGYSRYLGFQNLSAQWASSRLILGFPRQAEVRRKATQPVTATKEDTDSSPYSCCTEEPPELVAGPAKPAPSRALCLQRLPCQQPKQRRRQQLPHGPCEVGYPAASSDPSVPVARQGCRAQQAIWI